MCNTVDWHVSKLYGGTMHTIIRLPEVKKTTGLSRSTIYKMMMENTFPATISLGAKSVGWLESDIQEWIKSRIEKAK